MKTIPLTLQTIDSKDIREVAEALKSDWITQGPRIKEFEKKLCDYTGAKFAVVVSSGTAALHVASLAAGIKPGDEVITSPITFVASANCILYCGGRPVFADVSEDSISIDPKEIEKRITKRTKAIIPVDFAGYPARLDEIRKIAKRNGLIVIEDSSHALGAKFKGSKIGSCRYSDMSIFSFHPTKSITTGEGGAVLTNNRDLYRKLLIFRNHGIVKESKFLKRHPGPWYYEMVSLGYNYRITDFQSVLGINQLKKIDKFISRRRKIAKGYDNAFKEKKWIKPLSVGVGRSSSHHLYVVQINFRKIKKSRKQVMQYLHKNGICTQVHYIPVHLEPYYRKQFGYKSGDFPNAESYYQRALSLPIFPSMKEKEVKHVINKILSLTR